MNLTPNQAHYVLSSLIARGKVRPSQVESALNGREREIRALKERLASLQSLGARPSSNSGRGRPRRRRMSPRLRALRRLQGRYMGFVRRLKAAEKARVRSVREKQGIEAAIRLASSLTSRS